MTASKIRSIGPSGSIIEYQSLVDVLGEAVDTSEMMEFYHVRSIPVKTGAAKTKVRLGILIDSA